MPPENARSPTLHHCTNAVFFTCRSCGQAPQKIASPSPAPPMHPPRRTSILPSGMNKENTTAGAARKPIRSLDLGKAPTGAVQACV